MKKVQFTVTILGEFEVGDNWTNDDIKLLIKAEYPYLKPTDIEFEVSEGGEYS